jgi:hypothetical protein
MYVKICFYFIEMGFLDFLKGVGKFVTSGISRIAPIVSGIAGLIPGGQGIAAAANIANTLVHPGTGAPTPPTAPAAAPAAAPGGVATPTPAGAATVGAPAPAPVM